MSDQCSCCKQNWPSKHYGDIGSLCYECYPFLGYEYKKKWQWLRAKRFIIAIEPIGWLISFIIGLWYFIGTIRNIIQ